MRNNKKSGTPILPVLRELDVGDTHDFPISRMSSVKASASMFGLEWDKVFSTAINREEKTITVTRVK